MPTQDAPARVRPEVATKLVIARYGNHRNAVGSMLFIWVNVSLMMAFGWAALVVAFDAPAVGVEALPTDWFIVRFLIILAAAGLTIMFWRSSMVPVSTLAREAFGGLFQRGILWSQGMLFLIGVSLVLAVLLLLASPGQATKLLLFGAVEVFAIQALFAGFMKTAFDLLFERGQSFGIVTGLFAVFFGLQSLAIAITSVDTDLNYYLALLAGGFLGAVVGAISLLLRDRSGSILPGFLVQLLVFYLIIPFVD